MNSVRLPRLSRPGVLESIAPERLFALLHPYADFFAKRSVLIESPDSIDCQAVIREITSTEDAAFSEIQEAFFGNTPIEFAIMSGPMTDPDSEGLRATCDIFNFTRNEALEEAIMVDVTIKPTYAANAPEWISGVAP